MENREIAIDANLRQSIGTGASRMARKEGRIPAIVYGETIEKNIALTVMQKEMTKLHNLGTIFNTKINLKYEDVTLPVVVKAMSFHPITDMITHVDFLLLTKKLHNIQVPIDFCGKESSPGLKRGGFLNKVIRSVLVSCPVNSIPMSVKCDVSSLSIGNKIQAESIAIPSGCTLITPAHSVIASIIGKS